MKTKNYSHNQKNQKIFAVRTLFNKQMTFYVCHISQMKCQANSGAARSIPTSGEEMNCACNALYVQKIRHHLTHTVDGPIKRAKYK